MSARRPEPSRRRRQVSPASRTATPAAPRRSGLTTRAAILGLAVCALVVSAALPLREYLSQRGEIEAATVKQAAQQKRVAALERQLTQLKDPAYVKTQATLRLHFVLPGETAYVVLGPAKAPSPPGAAAVKAATAVGSEAPWYSQVWGSVKAADRPATVPARAPARPHRAP